MSIKRLYKKWIKSKPIQLTKVIVIYNIEPIIGCCFKTNKSVAKLEICIKHIHGESPVVVVACYLRYEKWQRMDSE